MSWPSGPSGSDGVGLWGLSRVPLLAGLTQAGWEGLGGRLSRVLGFHRPPATWIGTPGFSDFGLSKYCQLFDLASQSHVSLQDLVFPGRPGESGAFGGGFKASV